MHNVAFGCIGMRKFASDTWKFASEMRIVVSETGTVASETQTVVVGSFGQDQTGLVNINRDVERETSVSYFSQDDLLRGPVGRETIRRSGRCSRPARGRWSRSGRGRSQSGAEHGRNRFD